MKTLQTLILAAALAVALPLQGAAFGLTEMLEQMMGDGLSGMGTCEAPATEPFFATRACGGTMQAIWDEDRAALRGHEAQLVLYAAGLTQHLASDTGLFMQGPDFLAMVPPKLTYHLHMARLRTPEVAMITLRDQVQLMEHALTPLWRQLDQNNGAMPADMLSALKSGLRTAGMEGKPSVVLPLMGKFDGYAVMSWAASDPDAAAEFLARLDRLLEVL